MDKTRWEALCGAFERCAGLRGAQRTSALAGACGSDAELRTELLSLLAEHDRLNGILDSSPAFVPNDSEEPGAQDQVADTVGPYRLLKRIGEGGMGSVWLAERRDGMPKRAVALKLPHSAWIGSFSEHMARERDILATLEHPNIARLYDAGVSESGRPYMALECVEGIPITHYCEQHALSVRERLKLLRQALSAIAYAHDRFVVHRDLKPSNILVSKDGRVHLLDFGIAHILDAISAQDAKQWDLSFTPEYASPEQIVGEPLTAASDVYSIAVVGYEMLTGSRPYRLAEAPRGALLEALRSIAIPNVSTRVRSASKALLRGDIDAIFGKALSFSAADRYQSVAALADDIERHLNLEPILIRADRFSYRAEKLFARYRWQSIFGAAALLAICIGIITTLWQSHQARKQAALAMATKDFLVSMFRANDARIASDKPKSEMTVRELLDQSSSRIAKDFARQPELQIELMGLTATIYDHLADETRYAAAEARLTEFATAFYGPDHPIVIEGLLNAVDAACLRKNFDKANQLLADIDQALNRSRQNATILRAKWWREKARVLVDTDAGSPEAAAALDKALGLYARTAPRSNAYANTLSLASVQRTEHGDFIGAEALLRQAVAVAESAPDRDDSAIGDFLFNLARSQERIGNARLAESTYERVERQAQRTYGEHYTTYWIALAYHARLLHYSGQREAADGVFARMLQAIPADWNMNGSNHWAHRIYAGCLAADGRAQQAVPLLEAAYQYYTSHEQSDFTIREVRRELGDAYDAMGRGKEARQMLQAARDESIAKDGDKSPWALIMRERWGRFLLDHARVDDADFTNAESEFETVLQKAAERPMIAAVLAHAGLARIAAARGQSKVALEQSDLSLSLLEQVPGIYDIRLRPRLFLVRSKVLLDAADSAGAQQWARKALEASMNYDVPQSAAILAAQAYGRVASIAAKLP